MPESQKTHIQSNSNVPIEDFLIRDADGSFFHSSEIGGSPSKKGKSDRKPSVKTRERPSAPPPLPRATDKERMAALQKVLQDLSSHVGHRQKKVGRLDRVIGRLLTETKTTLHKKRQQDRFRTAVSERLGEKRDELQLVEFLTRGEKVGGVGIDPESAMRMSRMLNQELGKTPAKPDESAAPPESEQHGGALNEIRKIQRGERKLPSEERPEASQAPSHAKPAQKAAPIPASVPEELPGKIRIRRPDHDDADGPKIQDIKSPRQLVGPVDELRLLSIVDFRRMGANLEEIHEKLNDKFEILREESLTKLSEGINAWKESEVYRTYIRIGRESMESDKPIHDIILARSAKKQPYLTQEEFDLVSDLNKELGP